MPIKYLNAYKEIIHYLGWKRTLLGFYNHLIKNCKENTEKRLGVINCPISGYQTHEAVIGSFETFRGPFELIMDLRQS